MNVLAVAAHPDDIEIYCYGTLAKYAARGDNVYTCTTANGMYGHATIRPEELKKLRYNEAQEASKLIGAEYTGLDIDDLHVDGTNHDQIMKLAKVIKRVHPDVIITHYDHDYMDDHSQTSKLVMNASFAASIQFYDEDTADEPLVPLCPVFYMDTAACMNFTPTEYVDITDTLEIKLQAFQCHKTQMEWLSVHDQTETLKCLTNQSYQRGHECGVAHAEAFRACCEYGRMTVKRMLP